MVQRCNTMVRPQSCKIPGPRDAYPLPGLHGQLVGRRKKQAWSVDGVWSVSESKAVESPRRRVGQSQEPTYGTLHVARAI